jgi:hypothetical protein
MTRRNAAARKNPFVTCFNAIAAKLLSQFLIRDEAWWQITAGAGNAAF